MIAPWRHGDPHDLARAIVAEPRFRHAPPLGGPTWWDRFWSWLGHLLAKLFHSAPSGAGDLFSLVLVGAVLVGVVAVVVLVLAQITLGPRARARRRAREAEVIGEELDAAALRARARAAVAAQRYREAAALLWASALRALDERGRVRFDAARTPSEWRRLVREPAFDALARDAVFALFDERTPDADALARMDAAYDVLLSR
ncbi:MAG TPA: hypothetical protein VMD91_12205 [Candidatus Sulfotelmatobacter sp.]|nr:hypothetical protein [Candidatus Sulfotelmatobacter sp.]